MNTPNSNTNIEPRWATYLKAAGSLAPAIIFWMFAAVFLMPKVQQFCMEASLQVPFLYRAALHLTHRWFLVAGALALILFLLEWRSDKWPRYRRATVGVGVFALNSTVLLLITVMVVLTILAAPALLPHAK